MFARNPFEAAVNTSAPATDMPRPSANDMMADAFLSEVMDRLRRGGHMTPMRYPMAHREQTGLPLGPGLRDTHHTYQPVSANPARVSPFGLGARGQAFYEPGYASVPEPRLPTDPFDPAAAFGEELGDEFSEFDLDLAVAPGVDGAGELSPFDLPPQPRLPSVAQYSPDPGLDALRRAIRPGYANLSTYGYSEPVTDPYAEDLNALLRRLVRQA